MEPQTISPLAATTEAIFERLQQAATDGKFAWVLVARFATAPAYILSLIPYDIVKEYGLPRSLPDASAKSYNAAKTITHDDILRKIERAVTRGVLEPQTLGLFARNPNAALTAISDDVRKSYGLPERLPLEPMQKSTSHELAQTNGVIFSRLGDAARASDLHVIYQ